MARKHSDGRSLEFSKTIKEEVLRLNQENAPRGCAGYWCEWCYFSSARKELFQVDHIVPAARMQDQKLSYAQIVAMENACVLCVGCNASKGKHGSPRHGMGLAYRMPNQNMTHGERRVPFHSWDDMVRLAQRKGRFRYRD